MTATAGYNSQFLVTSTPSISTTNEATTTSDLTTYTISTAAHRYFDKSQAVTVQTSPDGVTWTTVTTGFTLYYVNARVVFGVAQPSGTQVRFSSAYYFPYAAIGNAYNAEFAGKMDTVDTTYFNTSGTKTFTPTLISGTLKCSDWWLNETLVNHLTARDLLVVSFQTPTGARYEGFCYVSDCDLKTDVAKVIDEALTFQLTDQFFNN